MILVYSDNSSVFNCLIYDVVKKGSPGYEVISKIRAMMKDNHVIIVNVDGNANQAAHAMANIGVSCGKVIEKHELPPTELLERTIRFGKSDKIIPRKSRK